MAGVVADGAAPAAWTYTPAEMLAPVSGRLEASLRTRRGLLDRLRDRLSRPVAEVDLDGLYRSFIEQPVEGIDPGQVWSGRG
jgi:hypothetical protein